MRIEEFQDFLENDLAWRKMEISQLFMILNTVETKDIIGKSMILLLYAHWEGFIKKSSKYYLRYVSDKNITLNALTRNFEAIMLKKYAKECIDQDSNNLMKEFAFMDAQYSRSDKPFNISIDVDNEFDTEFIDTQRNLSSKVLKGIIQIVGIKYNDTIQTRGAFLDVNLLRHRNSIGHGNQINQGEDEISPLDFAGIVKLKEFVVSMLDYYAEVLLKYVEEKFYLISNEEKRIAFEAEQNDKLAKKLASIESKEN
jgi:hypothetical protein